MGKSASVTLGKGSLNHNNRVFHTENVDPSLTPSNVVFVQQTLKETYREIFGEALERYNQKQKRTDRKIPDYLEHIQKSKNGEKLFHELVVQVGDRNDTGIHTADAAMSKEILTQYYLEFIERNPNMRVFNAVIHMDEPEGTPHLHLDFVPVATGQKRGLENRNSMRQALQQQGFDFQPTALINHPNITATYGDAQPKIGGGRWLDAERGALGAVLERNGIGRDIQDVHREHLTVKEYKACAELMYSHIQQTPCSELGLREPTLPMKFAGIKEEEVIVRRSSVETLQQENALLRAKGETDRTAMQRIERDKEIQDGYVMRALKWAQQQERRAECSVQLAQREANETKAQYSPGVAAQYNELGQKYNKLATICKQLKARYEAVEQENVEIKGSIQERVNTAVEKATGGLRLENSQLQVELDKWKLRAVSFEKNVHILCQVIHDIARAVFTLKYGYQDKSSNPYKSALTDRARHLVDALEQKSRSALLGAGAQGLEKRLSGMGVTEELEQDVSKRIGKEKPKGYEIGG